MQHFFYGELDGKPGLYRSFQFTASFKDKISLEKANRWNKEKRFLKVYADDDGDLALDQDIDLTGGVTKKFLDDKLTSWRMMFLSCLSFVSS